MNSLYIWINIITLSIPLLFSFGRKKAFYRNLPALIPAIIITAIFFLMWDQWFIEMHIWGYNSRYILGYYLLDIPLEEVLFFITVPYACVFIYEWLKNHVRQNETFEELYRWFSLLFFGISCSLLYWYNDRLYTSITCITLCFLLGTHLTVIKRRYMSWFYLAFIVCFIPIGILNAILANKEVIYYNQVENMDVRLLNIPVENFLYNMTLMGICIGLYEWFNRLRLRNRLRPQKQSS